MNIIRGYVKKDNERRTDIDRFEVTQCFSLNWQTPSALFAALFSGPKQGRGWAGVFYDPPSQFAEDKEHVIDCKIKKCRIGAESFPACLEGSLIPFSPFCLLKSFSD